MGKILAMDPVTGSLTLRVYGSSTYLKQSGGLSDTFNGRYELPGVTIDLYTRSYSRPLTYLETVPAIADLNFQGDPELKALPLVRAGQTLPPNNNGRTLSALHPGHWVELLYHGNLRELPKVKTARYIPIVFAERYFKKPGRGARVGGGSHSGELVHVDQDRRYLVLRMPAPGLWVRTIGVRVGVNDYDLVIFPVADDAAIFNAAGDPVAWADLSPGDQLELGVRSFYSKGATSPDLVVASRVVVRGGSLFGRKK